MSSCGPRSTTKNTSAFDVDAFLDGQVKRLSEQRITLEKHAEVNGVGSDSVLVPDSTGWSRELEVFRQLNDASPWSGDQGVEQDSRSNLKFRRHRNENGPLRELRVYYLDDIRHLRRLEGEVVEDNPMYSARRTLILEVEEGGEQLTLSSFRVVGYQKLALRGTANSLITGTLRW